MDSIWLWPLALVAVLFALPALRDLAARWAGSRYRAQVRETTPDFISLVRVREPRWRNRRAVALADQDLCAAGFAEAGTYVVHQMPELNVGLYALPAESAYAVIYDHPASGFWAELVTRYHDGTIVSFSTLDPMDVELPEGSMHVAAPELTLRELWTRMQDERPVKPMVECSRATAAMDFERGYAESVARHKRELQARLDAPPTTGEAIPASASSTARTPGGPPDEELREAA